MQIELMNARLACRAFSEAAAQSADSRLDLNVVLDAIEALTRYQHRLEQQR